MHIFSRKILLLFLGVAGCTVGPDYKKPTVAVNADWHTQVPTKESTIPLKDVMWWKKFNDPILDQLIEKAGQSNLDTELALARVREARANVSSSEAAFFPSLTATGAVATKKYGKNAAASAKISSGRSTSVTSGFDASWEIDVFGKLRRAEESAEANLESVVEDGRVVILSLLGEVALNYINLRNHQEQLLIQQDIVASWKIYSDLRRELMESGLASDIDEIAADVSYNQALVIIPQIESSIQTTLNQICFLLGRQSGALDYLLKKPAEVPQMDTEILSNLPGKLIIQRPDVRKAEEVLRSANADLGVAEGNLYPSFSLTGMLSWGSTAISSLFHTGTSILSAGPGVSIPIFDFGKLRAQVDIQYAQRDRAFIQYKQAILTALQDVENSLIALASENQRLVTFKKTCDANKLSYDLNQDREHSGLASMFDVMQAKFTYLISKQNYVTSLATHSICMVNVYKSLGGGWNAVDVPHSHKNLDIEHIDFL
jgi:NodT family efflux transporter outer membrane factor (OMF) lipoprotein